MRENKKHLHLLNISQFLSALADSSIIITIALMISRQMNQGGSTEHGGYIFLVEIFFLIAYVLLAPWVGTFSDKNRKSKVLLIGNAVKSFGVVILLLGFNPAWSYGMIGIGAAIYGPSKYGILKELTNDDQSLLDANGKLESFTILAIIMGTLVGGILSDISLHVGTYSCLMFYLISLFFAFFIPSQDGNKGLSYRREARHFIRDVSRALNHRTLNFALIGTGSFWMISVVIKNGLLIWIPTYLGVQKGIGQSAIVGMTAFGIVAGALLAKKFTSIEKYSQANRYGFVVGALAIVFPFIGGGNLVSIILVCGILFLLGVFAGLYVIPLNAVLQKVGHDTLGVGKTIAIQNLTDNSLMLIGTCTVYYLNTVQQFSIMASLITFAFVFVGLMVYITLVNKRKENMAS